MVDFEKYSFNKYSEKYKQFFSREKTRLVNIFSFASIEHIGSSSVRGLGGKGIVDISVSVPKNKIQDAIRKLEDKGYDFLPNDGSGERFFFQRSIKYRNKERRVHIHLTPEGSDGWKSGIAIRNYLRENKGAAEEYSELKKRAVEFAKGDGKKYRKYKERFLKKIEKEALKKAEKQS